MLSYPLQVQEDFLKHYKLIRFPPLDEKEYLPQFKYQFNVYHAAKGKQPAKPTFRERLGQSTNALLAAVIPAPGSAHHTQTPQRKPQLPLAQNRKLLPPRTPKKKPTIMATQTTKRR